MKDARWAFWTVLAIIASIFLANLARAHDWMPPETKWCCNDRDCLPYPREAVTRTNEGWVVKSTGQIFKDGDRGVYPNYRPDLGEVWICRMPTEPVARCLFILPEGS